MKQAEEVARQWLIEWGHDNTDTFEARVADLTQLLRDREQGAMENAMGALAHISDICAVAHIYGNAESLERCHEIATAALQAGEQP